MEKRELSDIQKREIIHADRMYRFVIENYDQQKIREKYGLTRKEYKEVLRDDKRDSD